MISKLTGLLDTIDEDSAVIDVNGVGYLVFCSTRTLTKFSGRGEEVSIFIETHIREDHIHLYGFLEQAEREWFRILTTVQGVGARVGLGILSVLAPQDLSDAIISQDKAMISRAPGVGPKLASRLLTELKDKVSNLAEFTPPSAEVTSADVDSRTRGSFDDAMSALVNLGYQRSAAFAAVSSAKRNMGEEAPVEDLIRAGLRELIA